MQQEFAFYKSKGFKINDRLKGDIGLMTRKIYDTPKQAFSAYKKAARHLKSKLRFQKTPAPMASMGAINIRPKPKARKATSTISLSVADAKKAIPILQARLKIMQKARKEYDHALVRNYNPYYWNKKQVAKFSQAKRKAVVQMKALESQMRTTISHLKAYAYGSKPKTAEEQHIANQIAKIGGLTKPSKELTKQEHLQKILSNVKKSTVTAAKLERQLINMKWILRRTEMAAETTKLWGSFAVSVAVVVATVGVAGAVTAGGAASHAGYAGALKIGATEGAIGGALAKQSQSIVGEGKFASAKDTLKAAAFGAVLGGGGHVGGHALHSLKHVKTATEGMGQTTRVHVAVSTNPLGRVGLKVKDTLAPLVRATGSEGHLVSTSAVVGLKTRGKFASTSFYGSKELDSNYRVSIFEASNSLSPEQSDKKLAPTKK